MINIDQQEERTSNLILLLKELENPDLDKHDLTLKAARLKDIYLSENGELYRHSYSKITEYMYSEHIENGVFASDKGTIIIEKLSEIANEWETKVKNPDEKQKLCSAIRKLIDHISLEVVRLSQIADIYYKLANTDSFTRQLRSITSEMTDVAKDIEGQRKAAKDVGEQIENEKKEIDEIRLDVKNHNTQSITVLSIFSCVVFAFTGGFSMISGSINALSCLSKQKSLLLFSVLLLLCTVLSDSIYMLLRAARNYSSKTQGHLTGFIWCNAISALFILCFLGLFLFYSNIPFFQ